MNLSAGEQLRLCCVCWPKQGRWPKGNHGKEHSRALESVWASVPRGARALGRESSKLPMHSCSQHRFKKAHPSHWGCTSPTRHSSPDGLKSCLLPEIGQERKKRKRNGRGERLLKGPVSELQAGIGDRRQLWGRDWASVLFQLLETHLW